MQFSMFLSSHFSQQPIETQESIYKKRLQLDSHNSYFTISHWLGTLHYFTGQPFTFALLVAGHLPLHGKAQRPGVSEVLKIYLSKDK